MTNKEIFKTFLSIWSVNVFCCLIPWSILGIMAGMVPITLSAIILTALYANSRKIK